MSKISDLDELTSIASDDRIEVLDRSDTTMSAEGTNKWISHTNLVANTASGTFDETSETGTTTIDVSWDGNTATISHNLNADPVIYHLWDGSDPKEPMNLSPSAATVNSISFDMTDYTTSIAAADWTFRIY